MREICLSGSTSGNRKQSQAKPDCGGEAKAQLNSHREAKATAPVLDSTLYSTNGADSRLAPVSIRANAVYDSDGNRLLPIYDVCSRVHLNA